MNTPQRYTSSECKSSHKIRGGTLANLKLMCACGLQQHSRRASDYGVLVFAVSQAMLEAEILTSGEDFEQQTQLTPTPTINVNRLSERSMPLNTNRTSLLKQYRQHRFASSFLS